MKLDINGTVREVDAPPEMPLLWVIRDLLGFTGTKFGCGMAQCGACTVHIDGQPVRSCVTPISTLRCPATSVDAAPTSGFARRSTSRRSCSAEVANDADPTRAAAHQRV